MLDLERDEDAHEAVIGPHGAAGLDHHAKRVAQRLGRVQHQVGEHARRAARDARRAVHEALAAARDGLVDEAGDLAQRFGHLVRRVLVVANVLLPEDNALHLVIHKLGADRDHVRDAELLHSVLVIGTAPVGEVETIHDRADHVELAILRRDRIEWRRVGVGDGCDCDRFEGFRQPRLRIGRHLLEHGDKLVRRRGLRGGDERLLGHGGSGGDAG